MDSGVFESLVAHTNKEDANGPLARSQRANIAAVTLETVLVRILLNGDPREVPTPLHVEALLAHLGLDPRMVAVERNRAVVRRAHYQVTPVNAGDEIEVVAFVGGG